MANQFSPFAHSIGPLSAKIALVGEAWGEHEAARERPFVGASGLELARLLIEAKIIKDPLPPGFVNDLTLWMWWERQGVFLTNTLAMRPQNNNMGAVTAKKADAGAGGSLPPMAMGQYLREEFIPHLRRLYSELAAVRPNIIIALGNTALWALQGVAKIGALRGSVTLAAPMLHEDRETLRSCKVIPTYHPASIFRNWAWRPIVLADLMKAEFESHFSDLRRPERWITINPTKSEVLTWVHETLSAPPSRLAIDIETGSRQIKMIGFARSRSEALVVPFWDMSKPSGSYWETFEDEKLIREALQSLIGSDIPKLFQNGLYDLQYIWLEGWRPSHCEEDSMLLHHSMFPEMPKGLGFLGSIYSNEASWKLMRHEEEMTKRDE